MAFGVTPGAGNRIGLALVVCLATLFGGAPHPAPAQEQSAARAPLGARLPAARPDTIPPPPPQTHAMARKARVSGRIGWLVADIDTGEVLDAASANHPFVPASVAKLPTAAYALDRLGPDHRFVTELLADGPVEAGVLRGDLILAGGGDPELDTDALAPIAAAIAKAGITRVEGSLRADPGPLPEIAAIMAEQPPDAAYNPAVSGLSLNFNRVRLEWPRRAKAEDVRVTAHATNLKPRTDAVRVRAVQSQATVLKHSLAPDHERWDIAAPALRRKGARWLPVRRPAAYTARVLEGLAETRGIAVTGGTIMGGEATATAPIPPAGAGALASLVPLEPQAVASPNALPNAFPSALLSATPSAPRRVLARHESRPLSDILRDMLYHSTNLTAELCGIAAAAGAAAAPKPTATEGMDLATSAARLNGWAATKAGFAPGDPGFQLANHSGLSLRSRLSPARLVALLRAAALRPAPAAVHDPRLPDGVAQLLRTHNIAARDIPFDYANTAVAAKTGTMTFVRGLAGYVTTPKGRRLAFAIFANDLARRAASSRSRGWAGRARALERQLIREWVRMADNQASGKPAKP